MIWISSSRRRFVAILAVGVAIVAGIAAIWRAQPAASGDAMTHVREVAAQGQRLYKRFKVEPILSDRALIRQTVSHAPRSTFAVDTNAPLDSLLDLYADFVYYRLGQPDVEVYKTWRLDHGYRWRSIQDLLDIWLVKQAYARYFPGQEFPDQPTPETLFDEFWTVGLDWHADVNRPVAICTDEDGLRISTAIATPGNPRAAPVLGEDNDEMIWHGAVVTGGRCWFDPRRSREQIITQYGQVTIGQVAAIIQFQGGYRCPLVVGAIWDPGSRQWMMETILLYNREIENDSGMEY